jgi:hypothetical protein
MRGKGRGDRERGNCWGGWRGGGREGRIKVQGMQSQRRAQQREKDRMRTEKKGLGHEIPRI